MLLGGLNLVRALGLGGIPVIVASPQPDWPALFSRYTRATLHLPPLDNPAAVVDVIAEAGERLAQAMGRKIPLYYGNDDYLALVQENHERLGRHYTVLLNEAELARSLIDKERFEVFARGRGVPVPRTLRWDELERWYAPVLVKPKRKTNYDDSAIHLRLFGGAGKARVFASGPELAEHPLARQLREDLVLQEFVPGDDRQLWSFHGFADEQGKLLAWFIGRKLRTYPALTGESTFLELEHDKAFAFVGRHVAARLGLRGPFKIDFKQDPVSSAWRVLEVNARYNLWHNVGARNGINLPAIAYDYLVYGRRPAGEPAYHATYRWLALRGDWRAFRELWAKGELGFGEWVHSLMAAPKVYDVFSWSDPKPFLKHVYREARLRIPRVRTRMLRWLFTAS